MTLALYARRKQIPLDAVTVRLAHSRVHAVDSRDCETTPTMLDHVDREIELQGDLSGEQRAKLLEIADKCPVHRTLTSHVHISTRLVDR
jgi:putative redox protein